jgi:hypothetical protein
MRTQMHRGVAFRVGAATGSRCRNRIVTLQSVTSKSQTKQVKAWHHRRSRICHAGPGEDGGLEGLPCGLCGTSNRIGTRCDSNKRVV